MNNHREICTLQFGHYSNFVGTHWWNIQEHGFSFSPDEIVETNHKILYREGSTLKGDPTYTPRLLLVDLKGSLGALPLGGELYEKKPDPHDLDVQTWDPDLVDVEMEAEASKNDFVRDLKTTDASASVEKKDYNFETDINVWSDFLYAQFHPRTVRVVKDYQHDSDQFNLFPLGRSLWRTEQFTEDFCDDLRFFVEECDNMQGFQVILEPTNAFSGLSSSCIEYLGDEYDKKSVLAIPVLQSYYKDYDYVSEEDERKSQINDSLRAVNLAMCFHNLSEFSSAFIPLSTTKERWRKPSITCTFPYVNYNEKLLYHTSCILAMALETFTLKYRLKKESYTLTDLSYDFCQHNRKLIAASSCLPFPMKPNDNLLDVLDKWEGPLTQSLTPYYNLGSDRTLNMLSVRGIPQNKLKKPLQKAIEQRTLPAYRCETIEEMFKFYLTCITFGSASQVISTEKPLDIKTPTPCLFNEDINVYGELEKRIPSEKVKSVPALAGLHSGEGIGNVLDPLIDDMKKIKIQRYHQFMEAGLELDEYKESIAKLLDFRDCYRDDTFL